MKCEAATAQVIIVILASSVSKELERMRPVTVPDEKPLIQTDTLAVEAKEAVLRELDAILTSPFFRTSNRSKQFLSYVVKHTLDGNREPLKERTLGAKLFQRPVGYATGDDPVVRVQAGEVRRRLEQYHHATNTHAPVRIDLPVGSYAPEFRWAVVHSDPVAVEPALTVAPPEASHSSKRSRLARRPLFLLGIGLALAAVPLVAVLLHFSAQKSALNQFWSPVLSNSEPVLICLAKPKVYRPSTRTYQKYAQFPGQFNNEWQRLSSPPPLQPDTPLTWSDMVEYTDYGVAAGDVTSALRMSAALAHMGKESQVKIGSSYSFADLRNSPAIVVGAFNNRWTMQMTSNLHFAFVEENGLQMIRDQGGSRRAWLPRYGPHGEALEDYGIVTRLLSSKTGNFIVATAGIGVEGTQAAAELVTSPGGLEEALRTAPSDWARKNLQIVVQTTVTDAVPGPPQVVGLYLW